MPTFDSFRNAVRAALSDESTYCATLSAAAKQSYLEHLTEIELLHRIKASVRWSDNMDKQQSLLATGRSKHSDLECSRAGYELDVEAKWFCTNSTCPHLKRAGIEGWCWLTNDWRLFSGRQTKTRRLARRSVYLAMFPTANAGSIGVQRSGTTAPTGAWAFSQCISGSIGNAVANDPKLFKCYWPIARQHAKRRHKLVFRKVWQPVCQIMHRGKPYHVEVIGNPLTDAAWAILYTDPLAGAKGKVVRNVADLSNGDGGD